MRTRFLFVAAMVAFLSSTTVLANTSTPTIQVENTTQKVKFINLSLDEIDDGTVITGKVTKRTYNSRVSPGHIDYAIYDQRGKLIDQGADPNNVDDPDYGKTPLNLALDKKKYRNSRRIIKSWC